MKTRMTTEQTIRNEIVGAPFPEYIRDWRFFRCMSNEADVLSTAITDTPIFHPERIGRSNVYDIGTGDGEIMRRIIPKFQNQFFLIDPSKQWLSIAKLALSQSNNVTFIEKRFQEDLIASNSVCLAIHVVYLLENQDIDKIILLPRRGINLIIVLDAPDSVFSELWEQTAPIFLERCEYTRNRITQLYSRTPSAQEIKTQVLKPVDRMDKRIRSSILSTMCYQDYNNMDLDMKQHAREVIQKHTSASGKAIECKSILYRINGN